MAALALAAVAPVAAASPADLFGFGPESQSMGGTGAAVGRGFGAAYGNPALLSRSRSRELSLGYQLARFSLRADGPRAPGPLGVEGLSGTYIGAVLPIPFGGVLEHRLVAGLGAFTPRSLIARARLLYPERPQFPVLADRAQTLEFTMGLGADLGHGVRVGAGARALAELVGTVVVRTDTSGRVGTVVDDQLVATYAPVVGVAAELGRGWEAGLTWRGALSAEFQVLVEVHDLGQLVIPDLHIDGVAQYDPSELQAEVGKRLGPVLLAAGATYKRWSSFPGWTRPTVECPPSRPDCLALRTAPVGFHDTVVPRLGAELTLPLARSSEAHLRGGWFFEPSPVPEQTGASNYFDDARHAFTIGYGVTLVEPLPPVSVDAFFQEHLLVSRTHQKGAGVDPANPGAPAVKSSGSVQNFGVVLGVRF